MSLLEASMEDLPVHVMVDILSRLPVTTIIHCKCVCKKWFDLVLDPYFADLQLSKSAGIMIYHNSDCEEEMSGSGYFKPGIWVEVEDELNHHNLHHDRVISLDLNFSHTFHESRILPVGSVNGMICLWLDSPKSDDTYICNPITREYMILPTPQYHRQRHANIVYCFGIGSLTREYKVVRIVQRGIIFPDSSSTFRLGLSEAEVYTFGTGQWRSLGHVPYWFDGPHGPFLNGHGHWTVRDQKSFGSICAFNFDKETFELFPTTPSEGIDEIYLRRLGVLNGCLCRSETCGSNLIIWVMKEYGIKKSWHKELVIKKYFSPNLDLPLLDIGYLIERFKDGTILMASYGNDVFVYCPRRKTVVNTEIFYGYFNVFAYRPSFHRLHNFINEKVHLF